MLRACLGALLWALLSQPLAAQQQITPEAFLDQAVGKTLTFRGLRSGLLVGEEQFLRRDLSVWADSTGRCTYGVIEIRGPKICFIYEDFPDPENCWLIFERDGRFLVMADSLEVQEITRITRKPISCEEAPLS